MGRINKKEILHKLKADYKNSEDYHDQMLAKIRQYRAIYNADKLGNEVEGKSAIVSKDSRRQSEWLHASLVDPFLSSSEIVKALPVTWEDRDAAEQNEIVLNTQFCRQFNRYNFMTKAVKVLDRDGTVIIQTGWDYEDEEVEVEVPLVATLPDGREMVVGMTTETQIKVLRNQPTAKVCRNEDVFIDPTCQDDMDNCQFVIYRYETDLSTLKKDGRYKNLDKIKVKDPETDEDYEEMENGDFKFEDDPRRKLLVYEYWGNYDINGDGIAEPVVCAWVNDTIIRLQDNPYPDKKPPFLVVPFNSVPFQLHGEANSALIEDSQRIKTAIIRGMIDNFGQSNNGQKGMPKGMLDPINKKRWLAGKNYEYNPGVGQMLEGSYNQIPGSAFDMLGLMNKEIESITGVMGMNEGIAGGISGSAAGARGVLDATSTRRLNIVRNIAENLVKPLMRKWMAYNAEFLEPEEVMRITNDEFIEVKRDDLMGKVDIDIQVSTNEDNKAKSQELSFLLQTLGNTMPFEITQKVMAQIARLSRQPDLEKEIKEFKPEPDPIQEQMRQIEMERMQLENELLKAQIEAARAGAQEDMADRLEKISQAHYKNAQTEKLIAETGLIKEKTDMEALKFIKEDEQIGHKERMEQEQLKHMMNLEQMQFQAMNNDTNIGMYR